MKIHQTPGNRQQLTHEKVSASNFVRPTYGKPPTAPSPMSSNGLGELSRSSDRRSGRLVGMAVAALGRFSGRPSWDVVGGFLRTWGSFDQARVQIWLRSRSVGLWFHLREMFLVGNDHPNSLMD